MQSAVGPIPKKKRTGDFAIIVLATRGPLAEFSFVMKDGGARCPVSSFPVTSGKETIGSVPF